MATIEDFQTYSVSHITPDQVEATGSMLSEVSVPLLVTLDWFIDRAGVPVVLLKNGMTSGKHDSPYHAAGKAADVAFDSTPLNVPVRHLVMLASRCGFQGVGLYWNGVAYSMHLDIGDSFRQWARRKRPDGTWQQAALIVDPADPACWPTSS